MKSKYKVKLSGPRPYHKDPPAHSMCTGRKFQALTPVEDVDWRFQ